MKKAFDWFVMSSQDRNKLSLTIKSLATFLVLFGVDSAVIDEGVNQIVSLTVAVGMLMSAGMSAYGFVRKFR